MLIKLLTKVDGKTLTEVTISDWNLVIGLHDHGWTKTDISKVLQHQYTCTKITGIQGSLKLEQVLSICNSTPGLHSKCFDAWFHWNNPDSLELWFSTKMGGITLDESTIRVLVSTVGDSQQTSETLPGLLALVMHCEMLQSQKVTKRYSEVVATVTSSQAESSDVSELKLKLSGESKKIKDLETQLKNLNSRLTNVRNEGKKMQRESDDKHTRTAQVVEKLQKSVDSDMATLNGQQTKLLLKMRESMNMLREMEQSRKKDQKNLESLWSAAEKEMGSADGSGERESQSDSETDDPVSSI